VPVRGTRDPESQVPRRCRPWHLRQPPVRHGPGIAAERHVRSSPPESAKKLLTAPPTRGGATRRQTLPRVVSVEQSAVASPARRVTVCPLRTLAGVVSCSWSGVVGAAGRRHACGQLLRQGIVPWPAWRQVRARPRTPISKPNSLCLRAALLSCALEDRRLGGGAGGVGE
jgi:hypothetical protein